MKCCFLIGTINFPLIISICASDVELIILLLFVGSMHIKMGEGRDGAITEKCIHY